MSFVTLKSISYAFTNCSTKRKGGEEEGEKKDSFNRMSSHWGKIKPKPIKQYKFMFNFYNECCFHTKDGNRTGWDMIHFTVDNFESFWPRPGKWGKPHESVMWSETPTLVQTNPPHCRRTDSVLLGNFNYFIQTQKLFLPHLTDS